MTDETFLSYTRLKLHIDTPLVEETWLDGYECAKANIDENNNPYLQGSTEHFHWQEGWWAGFYEEDALFNLAGDVYLTSTIKNTHYQTLSAKKSELDHLVNNIWSEIQNHHWYIRIWHVLAGIIGYVVVYELMAILVYIE